MYFICFKSTYCQLYPGLHQTEGVGVVQSGEEKAPGTPYSSLPVPEGTYKKAGRGLFLKACSDTTQDNGFKLKRVDLDWI